MIFFTDSDSLPHLYMKIDDDVALVHFEFCSFVNVFREKFEGEWVEFLISLRTARQKSEGGEMDGEWKNQSPKGKRWSPVKVQA